MTTLENRLRSALLIIDTQVGVVAGAYERDAVIANIAALLERARRAQLPVIWVRHSSEQLVIGSDLWEIVPELVPASGEVIVEKIYGDAFEQSTLEATLAERRVGRLLVAGAQTDACIRSTLHGALVRGYDVILVSDAHTTEDLSAWGAPAPAQVIAHTNLYWSDQTAPGRKAGTAGTRDVELKAPARERERAGDG